MSGISRFQNSLKVTHVIHHFDAEIELIPNIGISRSKDDPRLIIIWRMGGSRAAPEADFSSLPDCSLPFSSLLISVNKNIIFCIFVEIFDLVQGFDSSRSPCSCCSSNRPNSENDRPFSQSQTHSTSVIFFEKNNLGSSCSTL